MCSPPWTAPRGSRADRRALADPTEPARAPACPSDPPMTTPAGPAGPPRASPAPIPRPAAPGSCPSPRGARGAERGHVLAAIVAPRLRFHRAPRRFRPRPTAGRSLGAGKGSGRCRAPRPSTPGAHARRSERGPARARSVASRSRPSGIPAASQWHPGGIPAPPRASLVAPLAVSWRSLQMRRGPAARQASTLTCAMSWARSPLSIGRGRR